MARLHEILEEDLVPLYHRGEAIIERMKEMGCQEHEIEYTKDNMHPDEVPKE